MTAPPAEGTRRDHGCQTPACPNDFNVITIRVDDGVTNYLCEGCNLAFNLSVLQRLGEQGLLTGADDTPASAGASHPG